MHDALYQEIGRIAASWVAIEDMIDELLSHYIGVDRHVTAIVIEGMRGIDKEAVLRRLTSKKESDPIILREIENSLRACGLIRQYRNAILHRGIPGTASDYGLFVSWIGAVRAAIDEFCHYFSELVAVVSEALTLRAMVADSEDLDGTAQERSGLDQEFSVKASRIPAFPESPVFQTPNYLRDLYG